MSVLPATESSQEVPTSRGKSRSSCESSRTYFQDLLCCDEDGEAQALEALKGYEEQLDWMLELFHGPEYGSTGANPLCLDETFGDYDSLGETFLNAHFPLSSPLDTVSCDSLDSLLREAPHCEIPVMLQVSATQLQPNQSQSPESADVPVPSMSLEHAASDASTSTLTDEAGNGRRRRQTTPTSELRKHVTDERPDEPVSGRRKRSAASSLGPRKLVTGKRPGRPRVDPNVTFLRSIVACTENGGFHLLEKPPSNAEVNDQAASEVAEQS